MNKKDCDKIANIIATGIIAGDDELASQLAELSYKKRMALARSKGLKETDIDLGTDVHKLELQAQSADIKMQAIIQAKVLSEGNKSAEAYAELIRQYNKEGGTIAGGIQLLELVRNASPVEYSEIARLLGYGEGIEDSIKMITDSISKFEAGSYSIRSAVDFKTNKLSNIKGEYKKKVETVNKLVSEGKLTEEEGKRNIKSAKEEMEQKTAEAYRNAMQDIAEGKNPSSFVTLDKEWQAIKKAYGDDVKGAQKARTQYIVARELLSDTSLTDSWILDNLKGENLIGELTLDAIEGETSLELLMLKAYTNTKELCENGALRLSYNKKLVELAGGIDSIEYNKVNSLINTLQFSEQGATFSTILKYDIAYNTAKQLGVDLKTTTGKKLYNGIVSFLKDKEKYNKVGNKITIDGIDYTPSQIIQIIYAITGDTNIIKLLKSGNFDDLSILGVATKYLFGDKDGAFEGIKKLFSKATAVEIDNVETSILKTITGKDINSKKPIAYFNYKDGMYTQDGLNRAKADFMDLLAEGNKMKVASGIANLTAYKSVKELKRALEEYKGGYLIVNDAGWQDNKQLLEALNSFKGDDAITVIFGKGGASSNLTINNGILYYKTTNSKLFDDLTGRISIQTLGQATPTREMQLALSNGEEITEVGVKEYNDLLNKAAAKYYGLMLGVPGDVNDADYLNKVISLLSEKTGMPLQTLMYDDIKGELGTVIKETKNTIYYSSGQMVDKKTGIVEWGYGDRTYADTITPEEVLSLKDFKNGRTLQEIADHYSIPVLFAEKIWYNGLGYGFTMTTDLKTLMSAGVTMAERTPSKTGPHELFHAVLKRIDDDRTTKIFDGLNELYGQYKSYGATSDTSRRAEEMLVDLFSEYYRTGSFTLPKLEKQYDTVYAKRKIPGLKKMIKTLFKTFKEWIDGVDSLEKSMQSLFDDVLDFNVKTRFDDVSKIDIKKLGDAAKKYISGKKGVGGVYQYRLGDELKPWEGRAQKTGKGVAKTTTTTTVTAPTEPNEPRILTVGKQNLSPALLDGTKELWEMVNSEFALTKLVSGRYDKGLADVGIISNSIDAMNNEVLIEEISKDLKGLVDAERLRGNSSLEFIRSAYKDYKTAGNEVELLEAKGKIISLANGGSAETMSMTDIVNMFKSGNFNDVYKRMFFGEQEVSDEVLDKFARQINDNILDTLTISFSENIVKAGYSLPLENPKTLIYDYLTGNLDINNSFVQMLFFKNNIPTTREALNGLMGMAIPTEFKFGYEESLFKNKANKSGQAVVVREIENRFVQDTYSSIASIEASRGGLNLAGNEEGILTQILDKYIKTFDEALDSGVTFQQAQAIKQEASYALDMFEQDILLNKYGRLLTNTERQGLLGMKYKLPIAVSGQSKQVVMNEMQSVKENIIGTYREILSNLAKNREINIAIAKKKGGSGDMAKKIAERKKQLAIQGAVIKQVGGEYVVVDARKALRDNIRGMSYDILGLGNIRGLTSEEINNMSNKQVFTLLRYLDAANSVASRLTFATDLIYKQNPVLARMNFFEAFKTIDGTPKALRGNLLNNAKFFEKYENTSTLDENIKKDIFSNIKATFNRDGYLTNETLDSIINNAIEDNTSNFIVQVGMNGKEQIKMKNNMKVLYSNAFNPYTLIHDIPTGGILEDGTELVNVKERVNEIMKQQYDDAIKDIEDLGDESMSSILDKISIQMPDGSKISLKEASNNPVDYWKKTIFDDVNTFVEGADKIGNFKTSFFKDAEKAKQEVAEYRQRITNSYNSTVQGQLDKIQNISEGEGMLHSSVLYDIKEKMRRYTLTNRIIEAMDSVVGLNEEAAKGIKSYLIGFRSRITFGHSGREEMLKRLKKVQDAYRGIYGQSLEEIRGITPKNKEEDLAIKIATYFKTLENALGSADGLTGVTTREDINRAFYHMGETFMNIETPEGIFAMLSGIEQNEVLKAFKFSEKGQASYVEEFKKGMSSAKTGAGGYMAYVSDVSGITREEFNSIFGTNYNLDDFKSIMQGLCGYSLIGKYGKLGQELLNFLNSSSIVTRALMSYPFQLLTIPTQGIGYFLKQKGFEKLLGIEDLGIIDEIREEYKVLDGAYDEINLFNDYRGTVNPDDANLNSFYNRYGIPDIASVYRKSNLYTTDDYVDMYGKIDKSGAQSINDWYRWIDSYKDNANNIIDGIFSRNFKNIAFEKAIRENNYMTFASAEEFRNFMKDANVSREVKDRLMQTINSYSGRNFTNILGLGFGGINRPIGGGQLSNLMLSLMQMFNFRGAWGQNVFKQTMEFFSNLGRIATGGYSKEAKDEIARYMATQPEFTNFSWMLYNDLSNAWKLQRFQDNGEYPEEDMHSVMDFIDYITKNISSLENTLGATSQRFQGIQSFGPARPFINQALSIQKSMQQPEVYTDEWGVGAFFNSLSQNALRNRKPWNWASKALLAYSTDGREGAGTYILNEWYKLSAGTIRYMMDDNNSAYGYGYDLSSSGGIPGILMGSNNEGSDKQFSYDLQYNETWAQLKAQFGSGILNEDKKALRSELLNTAINSSQILSMGKNLGKAFGISSGQGSSPYNKYDLADVLLQTDAGKEFYRKGLVTPQNAVEAEIFFNTMLKNGKYRPGSKNFNKSLINFETYGHMNGKEKGNEADSEMELWLNDMKYNNRGEVSDDWNLLINTVKANYGNETAITKEIYDYAYNWLDNNSDNNNYKLYSKLLGQGLVSNLLQKEEDELKSFINQFGYTKKADSKRDDTEIKNSQLYNSMLLELGNTVLPGDEVTFFEKLQGLDLDSSIESAVLIATKQAEGTEVATRLQHFFNIDKDEDGTESISLRGQFKSQLKQMGSMERHLNEGNIEGFLADASILGDMRMDEDPTGIIKTALIGNIYHRVYSSNNISPIQKQEVMTSLFHNNKEFIERNAERLKDEMGSDYDIFAKGMGDFLYKWDRETIDNMQSIITGLGSVDEKKSGIGSAKALSSAIKNLSLKVSGGKGGTYYSDIKAPTFTPVVLKGSELVENLGLKGYTPSKGTISEQYKPHSRFEIDKDVSRKVKKTSTQAVSTKKQLSNIESKTEKALTAEA